MFGCLENRKENERKGSSRQKKTGELKASPQKFIVEVIDSLQTLTPAYIMLRAREVTKKPKPKATTKDKFGRKPKRDQNVKKQKAA